MPLVSYKALCLDVNDLRTVPDFWAPLLGLDVVPDGQAPEDCHLQGPTPQHTVWPCLVPEVKTAKNRVHVDVRAASSVPAGTTRLSAPGEHPWTIVAGPEGDEICVFEPDQVPDYRLYELVVDAADPERAATWWQGLWGGTVEHEDGFSWIEKVPGLPFDGIGFVRVPEPKTVKNRVHWDVWLAPGVTVGDVIDAGAQVLRERDDEIVWTVLADPEGNEFCVFDEGAA